MNALPSLCAARRKGVVFGGGGQRRKGRDRLGCRGGRSRARASRTRRRAQGGLRSAQDGMTETVHINVGGMTCAACQSHVQRALEGTPGVAKAAVNLMTGEA